MKYPIGIQTFEKIRTDGFVYVDKTALVHKLVTENGYYFLSRPRRFGKSLLLSTLHSYFDGRKDLFEGLAISALETQWKKHPVLHLDLNTGNYTQEDALPSRLEASLREWENQYGVTLSDTTFGIRFETVIRAAFEQTGEKVAVLIDEYDKPLLETIDNTALLETNRATLKGFYGAMKSADPYIQFALLTGVTKFSKVSIFSDLNNLKDITMDSRYSSLCGISEQELKAVFAESVGEMASRNGLTVDECYAKLKEEYDGYYFCEDGVGVYNPYSLLNALDSQKFNHYWFSTGTPTFLVKSLQNASYSLQSLDHVEVEARSLDSIDSLFSDPVPVMYQSGYLTIKGYEPRFGMFTLGFPNREVEEGFLKFLLPYYASLGNRDSAFHVSRFVKDLEAGNADGFVKRLRSFFADTPYELVRDLENHYQNVIHTVCKLMGYYVKAEYHTSEGRIDIVLQTNDYTYVIELKFDRSAEEALRQISDKNYALPFEAGNRKVVRIGMNVSSTTRNIEEYLVEC